MSFSLKYENFVLKRHRESSGLCFIVFSDFGLCILWCLPTVLPRSLSTDREDSRNRELLLVFVDRIENLLLTSAACLSMRTFSAHPHKRNVSDWCVAFIVHLAPEEQVHMSSNPPWVSLLATGLKLLYRQSWDYLRLISFIPLFLGKSLSFVAWCPLSWYHCYSLFSVVPVLQGKSNPCTPSWARSISPSKRWFNTVISVHFFTCLKISKIQWLVVQKVFEGKQWYVTHYQPFYLVVFSINYKNSVLWPVPQEFFHKSTNMIK